MGTTRRTETIAYQSSRMVKHVRLPQGNLKRISAAVLVDQSLRWDGVGPKAKRILESFPPATLKQIRDLVAAAIGFDAARGDQLILETLPFEATLAIEPPPAPAPPIAPPSPLALPPWLEQLLKQKNMALVAAVAGAAFVLLLAVTFFALRKRGSRKRVEMASALQAGFAPGALPAGTNPAEQARRELESRLADRDALQQQLEAEALNSLKLPGVTTKKSEVLTKHIAEVVKKDPAGAVQILRTWLADGER